MYVTMQSPMQNINDLNQKVGGYGNPTPPEVVAKIRHEYEFEGKRWETLAHENNLSYNTVRTLTKGLTKGPKAAA